MCNAWRWGGRGRRRGALTFAGLSAMRLGPSGVPCCLASPLSGGVLGLREREGALVLPDEKPLEEASTAWCAPPRPSGTSTPLPRLISHIYSFSSCLSVHPYLFFYSSFLNFPLPSITPIYLLLLLLLLHLIPVLVHTPIQNLFLCFS